MVVAIGVILARKFAKLKTLDVKTISEEKESQVKERILIQRLRRKAEKSKQGLKKVVSPSGQKVKKTIGKFHNWILSQESKYKREAASKGKAKGADFDQQMTVMVQEADELTKKEAYAEAEKKFIEIISLDSQNKKAYLGLVDVFLGKKEYQQAVQTLKHVLKLDRSAGKQVVKEDSTGRKYKMFSNAEDLAEDHIRLGEVYLAMGEQKRAMSHFQTALQNSPNDPKSLDLLIDLSIITQEKRLAWEYFQRLEQVNPDNQKLIEYKKKLQEM